MLNKKIPNILSMVVATFCAAMLFTSCSKDKQGILWGKTKWYDDFLFCKYEPVIMERTVCFEYNEDAKRLGVPPTKYALYEKVEEDFKPVKSSEARLYKNGDVCKDNSFTTTVKDEEVKIGIEFLSDAAFGTHKYYLKVVDGGGLDRVNGVSAEEDPLPLIEEWRAKKIDVWNPLALGLTWFGIVLLSLFLLWMLILKRIIYPTIGAASIMVTDPYYAKLNIHGKRCVIFANNAKPQSFLNKMFTGEIIYSVNPVWSTPLIMENAKHKKLRVRRNKTYMFDPFDSQLNRQTDYVIENIDTNEKIKISVN